MNAVAVIAPFPANIVSNTYAVDYGRTLGTEWMARAAEWNDPNPEFAVIIEIHSGDEEDIAVRVAATDSEAAIDIAIEWADRMGLGATGGWTHTEAEITDSWGEAAWANLTWIHN